MRKSARIIYISLVDVVNVYRLYGICNLVCSGGSTDLFYVATGDNDGL